MGGFEQRADHRGRCRLAVSAGDRQRPFEPHQFAQHLGAPHHRQAPCPCRDDFGVVGLDRRGDHDDLGRPQICRVMADRDRDAEFDQAAHVGAIGEIAALNAISEIVQNLGDAAHADAADADEMQWADGQRQRPHAARPCAVPPDSSAERQSRQTPGRIAPAETPRALRRKGQDRAVAEEIGSERRECRGADPLAGRPSRPRLRQRRGHSRFDDHRSRRGRGSAPPAGRSPASSATVEAPARQITRCARAIRCRHIGEKAFNLRGDADLRHRLWRRRRDPRGAPAGSP